MSQRQPLYTQQELAVMYGVSQSTISNWLLDFTFKKVSMKEMSKVSGIHVCVRRSSFKTKRYPLGEIVEFLKEKGKTPKHVDSSSSSRARSNDLPVG